MGDAVTATSVGSRSQPRSCRCTRRRSIFVIGCAATFPGSGVGDGILARRASHTTRDIVTSQNGTRSPPLWRSRETVDVQYAHTGEEATGIPITCNRRRPSIIVIRTQSIIVTTLTLQIGHWAYMVQTHPGLPSWESLPSAGVSVPAFLSEAEGSGPQPVVP